MASIRPYAEVQATLSKLGLVCRYHNSGAFSLPPEAKPVIRGWIGAEDPTIRPALANSLRRIAPPWHTQMAELAVAACRRISTGPVWVMPQSHWGYELEFGGPDWLPEALARSGVDAAALRGLSQAAALEFAPADAPALQDLLTRLLSCLEGSDFTLALTDVPLACTIHHHRQLWWVMREPHLSAILDELAATRAAVAEG